jgi:hypothetical protein
MTKLAEKLGYKYAGIIFVGDGRERLAFEKHLVK